MKSQTSFFKGKLFALLVMLTVVFVSASAQTVTSVNSENRPSLSVNYLGSVDDKLFFEVVMQQPKDTKSSLRIRDEEGIQLYSEVVTKRNLIKRIQLPKNELKKVQFVFLTGKEEIKKSYEIRVEYKEVLEIKDVTSL